MGKDSFKVENGNKETLILALFGQKKGEKSKGGKSHKLVGNNKKKMSDSHIIPTDCG